MNDQPKVHTFYRVTKRVPPDDDFYLTPQETYGDPFPGLSIEDQQAWDAWSFYNSEDGARRCAKQNTHLGGKIVRFEIPEGVGITWDPPDDEGHQNVRGDKEVLKRYLVEDWFARVKQAAGQEAAKGRT